MYVRLVEQAYFQFMTQEFSMAGGYVENLKNLRTVKIEWWTLVGAQHLSDTMQYMYMYM